MLTELKFPVKVLVLNVGNRVQPQVAVSTPVVRLLKAQQRVPLQVQGLLRHHLFHQVVHHLQARVDRHLVVQAALLLEVQVHYLQRVHQLAQVFHLLMPRQEIRVTPLPAGRLKVLANLLQAARVARHRVDPRVAQVLPQVVVLQLVLASLQVVVLQEVQVAVQAQALQQAQVHHHLPLLQLTLQSL